MFQSPTGQSGGSTHQARGYRGHRAPFQSPTGQSGGSTWERYDTDKYIINVSIPYGAIRWFYGFVIVAISATVNVSIPYGAIRWFYPLSDLIATDVQSFNPLRGNPVVLLLPLWSPSQTLVKRPFASAMLYTAYLETRLHYTN